MKSLARTAAPLTSVGLGLGLVAVLAVSGCNRDRVSERERERGTVDMEPTRPAPQAEQPKYDDRAGTTTITGGTYGVGNEGAVSKIVAARCAREASCNNVGVDKRYANSDACVQKVKVDMKDDLNAKECPRGIDAKELDECLAAIQKEECGSPLDTISRVAACRTSDLCLATGEVNR